MTHSTPASEILSPSLSITGELAASEDVTIRGRFEGQLHLPGHHLSVEATAAVKAKIVARAVTIYGAVEGTILAAERVELMSGARVRGHVTTPAIVLAEGAHFTGSVDPQRTESAMHVARYRANRGISQKG
jgi:Integral membrane protein CcmA involved in cell shape determination